MGLGQHCTPGTLRNRLDIPGPGAGDGTRLLSPGTRRTGTALMCQSCGAAVWEQGRWERLCSRGQGHKDPFPTSEHPFLRWRISQGWGSLGKEGQSCAPGWSQGR